MLRSTSLCSFLSLILVARVSSQPDPLAALCIPASAHFETLAAARLAPLPEVPPDLEKLRSRVGELERRAAGSRLSVADLVKSCEGSVEPLFAWVRDRIEFEAYPGSLRGAEGTLLARRGNAIDKALLLARLLEASGYKTRFVQGTLEDGPSAALWTRTLELHPEFDPAAAVRNCITREFVEEIGARARRDFAAVCGALGPRSGQELLPGDAENRQGLREHVWLQVETERGWIDLDPCFADAVPGKAQGTPRQTSPTLPANRHQRITLRVVGETLQGGKLVRKVALELSRPVADFADHDVVLFHVSGLSAGSSGSLFTPQDLGSWSPALCLDGVMHTGTAIAFDPPKRAADFGALSGGLGGDTGGERSNLSAEWLEIGVEVPGRAPETTVRALVDRVPPAVRKRGGVRSEDLLPLARDAQGRPLPPQAIHTLLVSSGAHDFAAWVAARSRFARTFEPADAPEKSASRPESAGTVSGDAGKDPIAGLRLVAHALGESFRLWTLLSDSVIPAALNDVPGVRFYCDTPRIRVLSVERSPGAETFFLRTDVVRQDLGVAGATPDSAGAIAQRRTWLGVLEGALEHWLLQQPGREESGGCSSASGNYTSAGMRVLRPGDQTKLADLGTHPDVVARLAMPLENGKSVVVNQGFLTGAPPLTTLGWWEVDAAGRLRAVLGADFGGAMVEFAAPASRGGPMRGPPVRSGDMSPIKAPNAHKIGGGKEYDGITIKVALAQIWALRYYALMVFDVVVVAWDFYKVWRAF